MENLPYINTMEELEALIEEWGFLPFFRNKVNGFSIFDVMDEERIFNDTMDCAWCWKSPILSHWECAYGKFFGGKAGYVHLKWLPDFINWRRALYPLDSYSDDALHILEVLRENESMPSRPLKRACGFSLARRKKLIPDPSDPTKIIRERHTGADFNALISRLQMGTYACIADFEPISQHSSNAGWTLSVYSTPEAMYDFSPSVPDFPFGTRGIHTDEITAHGFHFSGPASSADEGAPVDLPFGNSAARIDKAISADLPFADHLSPSSDHRANFDNPTWHSAVEGRTPDQSRERILTHLRALFPDTPAKVWSAII